jgi:hypothetical protein
MAAQYQQMTWRLSQGDPAFGVNDRNLPDWEWQGGTARVPVSSTTRSANEHGPRPYPEASSLAPFQPAMAGHQT